MKFESMRSQNVKKEKKRILQFKRTYFLYCSVYCSVLAGSLALHLKDDL
jgi:hypothetical protein